VIQLRRLFSPVAVLFLHSSCSIVNHRSSAPGITPPEWTEFAQRNAELAARLAADGGARSPESMKDQIHPDERTRGSSIR
jgi:hypothetical protein